MLPSLLTISGLPANLTFDEIKQSLDKNEHADLLKALAESRLKRSKTPNPSEVSFFCTIENGKLLESAFGNMMINDTALCASLTDAN